MPNNVQQNVRKDSNRGSGVQNGFPEDPGPQAQGPGPQTEGRGARTEGPTDLPELTVSSNGPSGQILAANVTSFPEGPKGNLGA